MWLKNIQVYDPILQQYDDSCVHIRNHLVTELLPTLPTRLSKETVLDLKGYYLYPGFIDSHCHLLGFGTSLLEKNLFETPDPSRWFGHMQADTRDVLVYRGWNEDIIGFTPTKQLLDSLEIDKPVLLTRKCGHAGIVNSKTLQTFSLNQYHQLDGTDLSTGFLTEKALLSLHQQMQTCKASQEASLKVAYRACQRFGICSVHTEDCSISTLETIIPLLRTTPLHLHEKIVVNSPEEIDQVIDFCKKYPDTDTFSFGSFKVYMDGSLGAHNANLIHAYSDKPNQHGFSFYTADELIHFIQSANHHTKQLAIHVIGDQALEKCIQAFEYVTSHSDSTMIHRLVHVQMASSDQLSRIKKLPLFINIQPVFAEADRQMAVLRLGSARLAEVGYPYHDIAAKQIPFSISSDAPVETMNPFLILSHAERFMSRKEAFFAYSVAGAIQSHFPNSLGVLKPGSYADGFILPYDLFAVTTEQLADIIPSHLLSNGEIYPLNTTTGEVL
ncbi:MAG: amidohydrolase family protein [Caldisericia bacterium]|nr:amidohydrolase family protein [Caldisericia bacterium]